MLFHEAVFTAKDPATLAEGRIDIHQRWTRALKSFRAAKKADQRMAIIFGDAVESVRTLVAWAVVRKLVIKGDRTMVEYEPPIRFAVRHDIMDLRKLSDGKYVDGRYLRAYIPCQIPDFLKHAPSRARADALEEETITGEEGRRLRREHVRIERDPKLVRKAKDLWRRKDTRLPCEVCGFSFEECYRISYIEAHHRIPLAQFDEVSKQRNTVRDLAAVCANCHRVLHRRPGLTVESLRSELRGAPPSR